MLARLGAGGTCDSRTNETSAFFITGQSGPGGGECNTSGTDDVFGCGTSGVAAQASCAPLDRASDNECRALTTGGWSCTYPDEARNVVKTDPLAGGGVFCCRIEI